MKRMTLFIVCLCLLSASILGSEYLLNIGDEIKGNEGQLCIEKFGRDEPEMVETGYLFIDLKYFPAPYKIERIGEGVVVNGILVTRIHEGPLPTTNEIAKARQSWTSPLQGYKEDTLKTLALMHLMRLKESLKRNAAVFLSSTREKVSLEDRDRKNFSINLTDLNKGWRPAVAREVMQILRSDVQEETKITALKGLQGVGGVIPPQDMGTFVTNCIQSTNLLERIRQEQKKDGATPKQEE